LGGEFRSKDGTAKRSKGVPELLQKPLNGQSAGRAKAVIVFFQKEIGDFFREEKNREFSGGFGGLGESAGGIHIEEGLSKE